MTGSTALTGIACEQGRAGRVKKELSVSEVAERSILDYRAYSLARLQKPLALGYQTRLKTVTFTVQCQTIY